ETGAREPFGPGHGAASEDAAVWGGGLHFEVIPQRAPERLEIPHRPAPQLQVMAEGQPTLALEPAAEGRDVGMLDTRRTGCPEQVALFHCSSLSLELTYRPICTRSVAYHSRGAS